MSSPILIATAGLPASGKSTFAARMAEKGFVVISPDTIREQLTGNMADQSKNREVFIHARANAIAALEAGWPVLIDATNVRRKDRREWRNLAHACNATFVVVWFDVPLLVCLWRNLRRDRTVPLHVMLRMAYYYRKERDAHDIDPTFDAE